MNGTEVWQQPLKIRKCEIEMRMRADSFQFADLCERFKNEAMAAQTGTETAENRLPKELKKNGSL